MDDLPDQDGRSTEAGGAPPSAAGRRLRTLFKVALLGVVAVLLLTNIWLNTLGAGNLSGRRFTVDWGLAWMVIPGRLHTRDLDLRVDGRRNQWHLQAEQARLEIRLPPLRQREFQLAAGRAQGVSYRLRRKPDVFDPTDPELDKLAPIEGLELTAREPRPEHRKPPWRILLEDVHLQRVEEVWIDALRLLPGDGEDDLGKVAGTADFKLRRSMELRDLEIAIDRARLTAGGKPWIDGLRTAAQVDLDPIAMTALRDPRSLSALDGKLRLEGAVEQLVFLQTLAPASQLDLDGHGTVRADIRLAAGIPQAGSTLEVTGDAMTVRAGGIEAAGRGTISAAIDGVESTDEIDAHRHLTLRVGLAGLELGGGPIERFGARADSLQLVLTGRDPTLVAPPLDPRLHLELPHFEIPDISTFQAFLPEDSEVRLLDGRAVLKTRIDLGSDREKAQFELAAEQTRLEFRGTEIEGAVRISGHSEGLLASSSTRVRDLVLTLDGASAAGNAGGAPSPIRAVLRSPGVDLVLPAPGQKPSQAFRLADQTVELHGEIQAAGEWWAGNVALLPRLDRPIELEARFGIRNGRGRVPRIGDDLRIDLRAEEVSFDDLSTFQNLIPPAAELDLEGGRGSLSVHLVLEKGRETAAFQVVGEDARATLRGTRLAGRVQLAGRAWRDRQQRRFAVSGLTLDYRGSSAAADQPATPLEAQLRLGGISMELAEPGPDQAAPRWLDQTVRLEGALSELGSWSLPLARVPWIRVGGQATIDATARISAERQGMAEGSSLDLVAPALEVDLAGWQTRASARVEGRVLAADDGSELERTVDVLLEDATLRKAGHPAISLPRLSLRLHQLVDGTAPEGVEGAAKDQTWVRLEALPSRPIDVIALNSYLPTDRLRLSNGTARLHGDLLIDEGRAAANLVVESRQLRIGLEQRSARAAANLALDLRASDLAAKQFEIVRGELRLAEVLFTNVDQHDGGWWAVADLESGVVHTESPVRLEARAKLAMRDTEPIVHLLGESFRAVNWLAPLLEIEDVDGTATVVLDEAGIRLEDMHIEGGAGLTVRGQVDLHDPGRALLLISLHHLTAGFEKDGDEHEVKLIRPGRWFERRSKEWRRGG